MRLSREWEWNEAKMRMRLIHKQREQERMLKLSGRGGSLFPDREPGSNVLLH